MREKAHKWADLTQKAVEVVRNAGDYVYYHMGQVRAAEIEDKSRHSLVSYVDREAEKKLVSGLSNLVPEAAFLTEEKTVTQGEGTWRWIIDPLDGTNNFLQGIPLFSVSVALECEGKLVIGLVYDPCRKDMYTAWQGGGAYCNEQHIHVSDRHAYADSLLITGFPYVHDVALLDAMMQAIRTLTAQTKGIRRLGSAALDLAYVASGKADAFYEPGLSPWDVAAGTLLVREAGGTVSGLCVNEDPIYGEFILADNTLLHQPILKTLRQCFC